MATGNLTAVVFGGGGFIGRHLVRRLGRSGAVVRVPSRHPTRLGYLRTAGVVGQIVPELVGAFDDDELAATIQGADVVINLIGILAEGGRNNFGRIHTDLAGRIAKVAAASGVKRLIHVSALGVDGATTSAYARSKVAGEEAVRAAFPNATIVRPSIVFGPEDSFFNRFAAMTMISPALPLIGGGHTKFQPVYVGDVADGIMAAIARPEAAGQTYEFGGPGVYSFKELMELLLAEIGVNRFLVPLPWALARLQAAIAEWIPGKPLTRDQVELLKYDNVLSGKAPGLAELGVRSSAVELILPTYLDRFLKGGRLGRQGRTAP
ncbi:MAG TPA: complex I NDUFA9 subunit family protein [Alphaproteobacteria bacterium]|jgi:NADH dehydrogenase|nr:complex I NDUFA9 subunit family protein [Alphaproteobacteria bacterium]